MNNGKRFVRVVVPLVVLILNISACNLPSPAPEPPSGSSPPLSAQVVPPPPPPPPPLKGPIFETSKLVITPAEVEIGSRVSIQVTVSNTGDQSGSANVTLMIDGKLTDTVTIDLAAGNSQNVSFSKYEYTGKTYYVDVGDLSGTFLVKSPPTPPAPVTPPPSPPPAPSVPSTPAAKDVSWNDLREFLLSANATAPLKTSATAAGIRTGRVVFKFRDGTRSANVFQTTDYGLVYVSDSKAEGSYVVWEAVVNYFFRGLPLTQIDIRYLHDQTWWAGRSSWYGVQTTGPDGSKLWDSPSEATVTW